MKITVVPDVHQTGHWREVLTSESDLIVFLGDYFDTHSKTPLYKNEGAVSNLLEIIEFKKKNPDKVELLIGNHDLHYISIKQAASQFQTRNFNLFNKVLKDNLSLFKVAVQRDGWTFSHAGITKTFLELNFEEVDKDKIIDELNNRFQKDPGSMGYVHTWKDVWGTGDSVDQGPLWVRPGSLLYDSAFPKQIVGHTELASKEKGPLFAKEKETKVIFLDSREKDVIYTFDTKEEPQWLEVENGRV